ncbi:jacalin-like lectin [Chromobacterium alticapitis]|uniref:Jacalin-like lectin domain protein n=1 Tax=Chromobacterium alticapitis TaxID=2073169 RepID=A0A2S5DA33_9NEIS|nr:jacalin-like lectin [Chromobacterium alticapitis]POZ59936.1 jacalin-like lectin domain protein [Chromobacterium alticapitis]
MCAYTRTQQFGGEGGSSFADNLTEVCRLSQINIRHGSRVDSIQGVWITPSGDQVTGSKHGGDGGELTSIVLAGNEYIVRVDGRSGSRVDQLSFTTNLGNVYGPYGGSGGSAFSLSGTHIGGFFGRSGSELDSVGFFNRVDC